uniref:Uncharacterized protein n=1 Tax=Globodera rostochiensis TaxID=31243 RepID=A0A914HB21_GLORO
MLKKNAVLASTSKMRSEEQIDKNKFNADFAKKALKEKSKSSIALKVGPFAAIKESEKRKKKNGSLDLAEEGEEERPRERASTTGAK